MCLCLSLSIVNVTLIPNLEILVIDLQTAFLAQFVGTSIIYLHTGLNIPRYTQCTLNVVIARFCFP